jgi:hypothetical protein
MEMLTWCACRMQAMVLLLVADVFNWLNLSDCRPYIHSIWCQGPLQAAKLWRVPDRKGSRARKSVLRATALPHIKL